MKKVLVTGAAGFIGSHLCDHLIKKNLKLLALIIYLQGLLVILNIILEIKILHSLNMM